MTRVPRLLAENLGAQVYHADWRALIPIVAAAGGCDALIVDAPYSERTHAGHDASTNGHIGEGKDNSDHRTISYRAWTTEDVDAFVDAWASLTRGWIVSVTDHHLAPAWEAAFTAAGRYVFAPLPYVAPGSRVRLSGDGPSSWTCWIVVARPKTREFASWGTLRGAYVLPEGQGGVMPVVGGKPAWLGCAFARDYSRPGDLIVDPCMGAGTFLVGAIREGRRAIGGDLDPAHAAIAAQWIREPWRKAPGQGRDNEDDPGDDARGEP